MVKRFIVPQVGKNELRLMLNLYDIEAVGVQSNFLNAVKFTKSNQLLHSIAIIFSDLEGDIKKKLKGIHLLQCHVSVLLLIPSLQESSFLGYVGQLLGLCHTFGDRYFK